MIEPTIIPQPAKFKADIKAADLGTLLTSIGASGVIALPEGKSLADVTQLVVNVLPAPLPDGTVAKLDGLVK